MACDICKKVGTPLAPLNAEYQTAEIKAICPDCEKVVNDTLWKIRGFTAKQNISLLKRFMNVLSGKGE